MVIDRIVPFSDFAIAASLDPDVQSRRERDLLSFSMQMHEFMRDEAELEEKEAPADAGSLSLCVIVLFRFLWPFTGSELQEAWLKQSIKSWQAHLFPNTSNLS